VVGKAFVHEGIASVRQALLLDKEQEVVKPTASINKLIRSMLEGVQEDALSAGETLICIVTHVRREGGLLEVV
jgi:hypothetical protein